MRRAASVCAAIALGFPSLGLGGQIPPSLAGIETVASKIKTAHGNLMVSVIGPGLPAQQTEFEFWVKGGQFYAQSLSSMQVSGDSHALRYYLLQNDDGFYQYLTGNGQVQGISAEGRFGSHLGYSPFDTCWKFFRVPYGSLVSGLAGSSKEYGATSLVGTHEGESFEIRLNRDGLASHQRIGFHGGIITADMTYQTVGDSQFPRSITIRRPSKDKTELLTQVEFIKVEINIPLNPPSDHLPKGAMIMAFEENKVYQVGDDGKLHFLNIIGDKGEKPKPLWSGPVFALSSAGLLLISLGILFRSRLFKKRSASNPKK